jgi:hypothetical protein
MNTHSIWQTLAQNIADNTIAPVSIPVLTTKIKNNSNIGLDALMVVYAPGTWGDLVGVFHVSPGVGPNQGKHSHLYVATASIGALGIWTVTNNGNPYSKAGSMGSIHIDSATGTAFLAYELEMSGGNTVAIRRYNDIGTLVNAGYFDEFQLTRKIHVAAKPNTWSSQSTNVTNVGTPSIESFCGGDINIRCHYSPEGSHDYPAKGIVSLGSSGGISKNWKHWAGFFANWVNNSLRDLGAAGKIGGRDFIVWSGTPTYIFEAQLVHDDWSSWRPFLLVPEKLLAFRINLIIDNTPTFANPHMVLLPGNRLLQTYFVPTERLGDLQPGTLLRVTQLPNPDIAPGKPPSSHR